jgi:hypothetical protein
MEEDNETSISCPICKDNKQKSKLYITSSFSTSMGVERYYDDIGSHVHDRNVTTREWNCSEGHKGQIRSQHSCPAKKCSFKGHRDFWIEKPKEELPVSKEAIPEPAKSLTDIPITQPISIPGSNLISGTTTIPVYASAGVPIYVTNYSSAIVNLTNNNLSTTVNLKEGQIIQASLKDGKLIIEDITTV